MPREIIEFSGPDYTGKTTQAEMLTFETWGTHVHNFGSFGGYGEGIPHHLSGPESFDWWFIDSSLKEMVDGLTSAYLDREDQAIHSDVDVAVYERGRSTIKAQIAANFATRTDSNVANYIDFVGGLVDTKLKKTHTEHLHTEVFLQSDDEWRTAQQAHRSYARTRGSEGSVFSDDQNEFYDRYLKNFNEALGLLATSDAFTVKVDAPAVDINNRLRGDEKIVNGQLPQLFTQDPLFIGLAGLSESGKSHIAELMQTEHGFTRLKLGYFNETQRGIDETYAKPNELAMHVVRFLATNRHLARVTLESLHGPEMSAELKLLLGERWKTVFIDLDEETRRERLRLQHPDIDDILLLQQQATKDATKKSAGVEVYREYADVVVDNAGDASHTIAKIMEEIV